MQRQLPFLPGNTFDDHLIRENHAKRQIFNYKNNQAVINDSYAPQEPQELPDTLRLMTQTLGKTSFQDTVSDSEDSKWLSLDRKVLRFYAFFREGVVESQNESSRVRKCVVYYYLEDDTIHVSEPRQDNSGIPQGSLIKRHRIPTPEDPNAFYSIENFNIGEELTFYGKSFRLVDCDKFTRDFLEMVGVHVPQPESYPGDEYTSQRAKLKESMAPKIQMNEQDREFKRYMEYTAKGRHCKPSKQEQNSTQQFLKNDRKVLQFFGCWDNRIELYGDFRKFSITYFLADNQIKIAEILPQNSGRDPFPVFVKKQTINNPRTGEIYVPEDLGIGNKINVFGRDLLIYDIDEYTRDYYRNNFGITNFTPIDVQGSKKEKPTIDAPPYNGYGTEEDSLGSWKYLVLKPPKKDIDKYMKFDRAALRFTGQLITNAPEERDRRFLVCFHMADDTLSVFEPPQRNSGIVGGKFLQRCRCKNSDTGKWFSATDFYVGASITVNNHKFRLSESDERTLNFMESDAKNFPYSDITFVVTTVKSNIEKKGISPYEAFSTLDSNASGVVSIENLRDFLIDNNLVENEQEVITLLRNLEKTPSGAVKYEDLLLQLTSTQAASKSSIKVSTFDEETTRAQDSQIRQEFNALRQRIFSDFKQQVQSRRLLFDDVFRVLADRSRDGLIGETDFSKVLNTRLHLNYKDIEARALVSAIFPSPNARLSPTDVMKILEGSSTFGRMRDAGKTF